MNIRLAFAVFFVAALLPMSAHAAPKKKDQKEKENADSSSSAAPSAKLEPFLEPCLDAVLASLAGDPKMPRVEVEKLRATFAVGQIKAKTQAQQQIYQNAMAVCDSLTRSMDERAKAKAAVEASATAPLRSAATGIIKSSPLRGVDAGANAEAIRKKQKDERKDADDVARREAAYMDSNAYRSWTVGAPTLRRGVMALYTRQVQLEALEERNAAVAAQAIDAAKAAEATKLAKAAQEEAAAKIAAAAKASKAAADEKIAFALRVAAAVKAASAEKAAKEEKAKVAAAEKAAKEAQAEAAAKVAAAEKAAKAAQEEAAAKVAAAEKAESEKLAGAKSLAAQDAYVGTWASPAGKKTITVNEDHTALKTFDEEKTNGAWNIVDGQFQLHWEEGKGIRAKLSEDGQRLEARGQHFVRQKS